MIRRTLYAFGVCAVLVGLSAGGASAAAGGAGTETSTSHEVEAFGFPGVNPCTGEEGVITASPSTSVFHITTHADGTAWLTGTAQGAATFVPNGPGPVFTGHFTAWFGESDNRQNKVEHDTSTFALSGPEGSRVVFHARSHASTNANGVVTVEILEKEHAHAKCV